MKIKDLIIELQKHNPEADVHLCSGTGLVCTDFIVSCVDMMSYYEDLEEEEECPHPPACDGSCKIHAVELHYE